MSKFNIVKKGYDISEVESYLAKQAISDKQCIQDKSLRIEDLIAEVNCLKGQLSQFKSRESNVNNALITALDKAQEMEYVAKMRYELELERVKIFRNKWMSYCDNIKEKCKITESKGEVIGVLDLLVSDLADSISNGIKFSLNDVDSDVTAQYREEANRILNSVKNGEKAIKNQFEAGAIDSSCAAIKPRKGKSKEIKEKITTMEDDIIQNTVPSEIDDIINNPDFEDLCKKLGLA